MIWRDVKGYEGLYQISEYGDIRKDDGEVLSVRKIKSSRRYRDIKLTKNKTLATLKIHRLVYLTFIGEIDDNLVIDHIDTDRNNNHYSNLEQITQQENIERYYVKLSNNRIKDDTKICKCCKEYKLFDMFYKRKVADWNPDKWRPYCIECFNKKRKK
jgi:hypothetical protein